MIRGGLGVGQLTEAAKLAYVLAAIDEVIPAGRRPNVSQLSVVTGLTRKEIAAMLRDFAVAAEQLDRVGDPPPLVEFKDLRLPAAQQVALFLQVFSKRAAGLLEGVDQWMRQQGLATHDKASGSAESRVGIGVYLLHE